MGSETVAVVAMVCLVLVLAIFAAGLWFAWNKGIEAGKTKAELKDTQDDLAEVRDNIKRGRKAEADYAKVEKIDSASLDDDALNGLLRDEAAEGEGDRGAHPPAAS